MARTTLRGCAGFVGLLGTVALAAAAGSAASVAEPGIVRSPLPAVAPSAPSRGPLAGVRLAPASPGSVRFTVEVPAATFTPAGEADEAVELALADYENDGRPGEPPSARRVVSVAVPPLGPVRVQAVASAITVREGTLLEPVPAFDRAGHARTVARSRAYAAEGSVTPVAARLLDVSWVRNQRVARISIEPVAYQPLARRVSVAGRIDVDVQVQPLGALGTAAETDDPFELVYRSTLANYEQGRVWRRPATAVLAAAARRLGLDAEAASAAAVPETSIVLAGHMWVKLAVRTQGFVSVNFSTLRNTSTFGGEGTTFDRLRLFTLPGYPLLPQDGFCDSCAMREVALQVAYDDSNDTRFSSNLDAFYFFAQGPSGWASDFDSNYPDTAYLDHPYEAKNYYYLAIAPAAGDTSEAPIAGTPVRIASRSDVEPTGAATVVTSYPERARFEEDHASEYWPDASPGPSTLFWEKWFWASLTEGEHANFTFDLPDADLTQPARFRLRQWGVTDNKSYINENPCYGPSYDHYLDVSFNGHVFTRQHWDGYAYLGTFGPEAALTLDVTDVNGPGVDFLRQSGNLVSVAVPDLYFSDCPYRVDRSALAWFEVYYQHLLRPRADSLAFRSPGAVGPYRYDIGPFDRDTPPRLFDVTDPLHPVELLVNAATMWNAPTRTLSFEDTASVVKRYRVLPDSVIRIARMAAADVADAPATSLTDNLRSTHNGADYVIIYYDGFTTAAERLAEGRRQRLPIVEHGAPYQVKAVPVSALFDQFSGGRTDPAAIRNFLRAAYLNWSTRPKFVMLLGDASYDYKDLKGQAGASRPGCLLPTFENDFDANGSILRQFASDDRLLSVVDAASNIPDFFGGRIPAGDAQVAGGVVEKILAYDTRAPLGEYRNSVVLLADDDVQGESRCDKLWWNHLSQTDGLNLRHVPTHVDRHYVYLHTYATGAGGTKPAARAALKGYLNGGVGLFNYIGHGSPFKITDESVFIDTDAGSLSNSERLFAFVAASCDVGKFNDPTVPSLGEGLVTATEGGAVAVISATEQALSGQNTNLNYYLYDQIFNRGTVIAGTDTLVGVGQYHVPFSTALLAAKISAPGTAGTNNRKYQLMGDPATTPNLPHFWTDVTLEDTDGNALTEIARGQTVVFKGRLLDQPGGQPVSGAGRVSMLIEDSAPTNSTLGNGYDVGFTPPCYGEGHPITYRYASGPIYHGDVSVTGGLFAGRFVVPMDATLGTLGRLRAYSQSAAPGEAAERDGVGASTLTLVGGTPPATDTQGPVITLRFAGGSQSVRPDATLQIDLADESGIMTTAHAPQNSIIVTLDGNTTSRTDVTSSFRYAADSYQHGIATFQLPGLSAGHHRVSVSAADNLATGITGSQHRASATLEFDVADQPSLSITRAFMFPNPMRSGGSGSGGTFIVDAPGDSLNALVRIFTVSGRLVRTLQKLGGIGQVQIPWDGLDAEGDPLANGTYLFKVYANVRDADGSSSSQQKDAAVGRIVVLRR